MLVQLFCREERPLQSLVLWISRWVLNCGIPAPTLQVHCVGNSKILKKTLKILKKLIKTSRSQDFKIKKSLTNCISENQLVLLLSCLWKHPTILQCPLLLSDQVQIGKHYRKAVKAGVITSYSSKRDRGAFSRINLSSGPNFLLITLAARPRVASKYFPHTQRIGRSLFRASASVLTRETHTKQCFHQKVTLVRDGHHMCC